ncbi:TonB-dependent receptor [Filimonas lacunae]|nr:TonB-dependent receptor [Filimonas lacunae]
MLTPVFLLLLLPLLAQNSGYLKGHVVGSEGPLAGATVSNGKITIQTDINGDFALLLPAGAHSITVSYVGHQTATVFITIIDGGTLTQTLFLPQKETMQEVVVVGSRNPRRSATESPVPVDVIPLKQIANQVGQLDVTQLLNLLAPSFNSVRQALGDGTDHIDPAQLRGLGPDQVLVLVNGKRYHQSSLVNVNGTVNKGTTGTDLNSIPASAIDRIEVLRDGASAQYGSDAIAGVINIVLKKNKGLTLTSSVGEQVTSYDKNYAWNKLHPASPLDNSKQVSDGRNFQVSANYGVPMQKGYLSLNAEYLYRGPTSRNGLYTGQLWPAVGGVDKSDSINASKGLTRDAFDIRVGNTEIKGGSLVLNFGYPIGKNLELYVTGIANRKNGYTFGLYRYPFNFVAGSGSFPAGNSGSANAAAIVASKYPIGFLPGENSKVRDYHATAGVKGKLGGWQVDASETFGANTYQYLVSNSANYTQAYLSGMTADQLQTSFNSGKTKTYQSVTNIDISKNHDVMKGLNTAFGAEFRVDGYGIDAGEINSYADLTNPTNSSSNNSLAGIAGAQVFAGFLPSNSGTWNRTSVAVYTDNELQVNSKWLVSGALRYEHFSDFGSTLNYKIATRYKLTHWLSLRGATSSGFRAPSLQQEHYSKVTTSFVTIGGTLTPVQAGTFTNDSKIAEILGIPKLKQETSTSYSVGATAKIARGFDITVDAYQIDINDRIVLSNTFRGNTNSAAGIALGNALNAAGAATASVFANAINTRSRGIEGVISYTKNWGSKQSLTLNLAHSSIQNRVKRNADNTLTIHGSEVLINTGQLSSYFNRADQSRIETYSPQTKDVFTLQYRYAKYSLLVRLSYFGKVSSLADTTGGASMAANAFNSNTIETIDQTYGGKLLTDITLGYTVNKNLQVNVGANNLFDIYPDKQQHYNNTSTGRFTYSRAVSQFGFNGRYLFARITLTL